VFITQVTEAVGEATVCPELRDLSICTLPRCAANHASKIPDVDRVDPVVGHSLDEIPNESVDTVVTTATPPAIEAIDSFTGVFAFGELRLCAGDHAGRCLELLPWLCSVIQKLHACGRCTGDEIAAPRSNAAASPPVKLRSGPRSTVTDW
jgi:hypothetical protein